jgi:hypothetical protein
MTRAAPSGGSLTRRPARRLSPCDAGVGTTAPAQSAAAGADLHRTGTALLPVPAGAVARWRRHDLGLPVIATDNAGRYLGTVTTARLLATLGSGSGS